MTRKLNNVLTGFVRILNGVIDARLPVCLWLDNSTLGLYRNRL